MNIKVSVPGKIILSGEHAVVYGKPALAVAVDKYLTVVIKSCRNKKELINAGKEDPVLVKEAIKIVKETLEDNKVFDNGWELTITSKIPVGVGMGSSAAVSVGVITALMALASGDSRINDKKINDLAYKVEKKQHGNPSGIDNSTVTFGGVIWYRKEFDFLKTLWRLPFKIAASLDNFHLVNTGKPVETTGEMVSLVSAKLKRLNDSQNLLDKIEQETKKITVGLREVKEDLLKKAIKDNQRLLEKLGVVGIFAKTIVREIEQSGGVAKISGAGGIKDKSGILLVYHHDQEVIKKIARKYKLDDFKTRFGVEGIRVENLDL